ncbi:hypothetical protein ACH3XW_37080 [Acanthocheilonema viteae]|uniref:Uncharacterized protein n=1 Tax=Acanthocheilonema viteae TaxID=6277 RepID=A0A498S780_ACAVI|nr:unnamed protein product [Acanthocheilonema viteae]
MNQVRDLANSANNGSDMWMGSQQITDHVIRPNTSVSYDSGIDVGINVPVDRMTGADPSDQSSYISATEHILHRMYLMNLSSDEPNNNEDENKENISPISGPLHNVRASTPIRRNPQSANTQNIVRIFSRSTRNEQEREHRPSSSSSALLRSPFRLPDLSPIRATPRRSQMRRRARTIAMEEAVDVVPLEDLPEINPFGPNGTPPRTPSPLSEIHSDSGHGNSNENLNNERNANERGMTTGAAHMATIIGFVTPPSRPLPPPMAPRKKKVDRRSVPDTGSPSFFPKTTARLGLRESHVKRFVPSPINTNASSMILRSAMKPRRSTRTKRMPIRYNCDRPDLHKKPRKA